MVKIDASMGNLVTLDFPKRMMQECPLCGVDQPIYIKGICNDLETRNKAHICHDKGYSFCNCHNIFFTDWSNIDQKIYDDEYVNRYAGEETNRLYNQYAEEYFPIFKRDLPSISIFREKGGCYPFLASITKWPIQQP